MLLPDTKLIRCFLIGAAGQKVPFTVVSADQATITFFSTASVKQTFVLTTDNDEQCQLTITQFIPRQLVWLSQRYRIEATNLGGEGSLNQAFTQCMKPRWTMTILVQVKHKQTAHYAQLCNAYRQKPENGPDVEGVLKSCLYSHGMCG